MGRAEPTAGDNRGARAALATSDLVVVVDASAGPRVSSLRTSAGEELLARLDPPLTVGPEDGARCDLHGGHRLWVAPEVPAVTYACDDGPARLHSSPPTAVVEDDGAPVSRRLAVTAARNRVQLEHTVTNTGNTPLVLAPWALTQLRPGGTVCLPIGRRPVDEHGLQASGSIVVWPYTRLDDPRVRLEAAAVTIDGSGMTTEDDPIKIGVDGTVPWLAYVTEDTVVVVHTTPRRHTETYADLGAVSQSYVCSRFTEVETLGPLHELAPGQAQELTETWTVHRRTWTGDGPLLPHLEPLVAAGRS